MLKIAWSYLHSCGHNIGTWLTDGRTDGRKNRRNPSGNYSTLHCQQCGRAVKTSRSIIPTRGHSEWKYYTGSILLLDVWARFCTSSFTYILTRVDSAEITDTDEFAILVQDRPRSLACFQWADNELQVIDTQRRHAKFRSVRRRRRQQ